MNNTTKLNAMLEAAGYKAGSVAYNNAFKQAKYHMDKAEVALRKIAKADFSTVPPKGGSKFEKNATDAVADGKKNTVTKAKTKSLAKKGVLESYTDDLLDPVDTLEFEDEIENSPRGYDNYDSDINEDGNPISYSKDAYQNIDPSVTVEGADEIYQERIGDVITQQSSLDEVDGAMVNTLADIIGMNQSKRIPLSTLAQYVYELVQNGNMTNKQRHVAYTAIEEVLKDPKGLINSQFYIGLTDTGRRTATGTDLESTAGTKKSIDAAAKSALATGKKNTVGKGEGTKKISKSPEKTKLIKNGGADAEPKVKGSFDKNAKKAEAEGKSKTVTAGNQKSVAKVAKKLLTECAKHGEFIAYIRSWNDGSTERASYLEGIVNEFTEEHDTAQLFALTKTYMEAAEDLIQDPVEGQNVEAAESKVLGANKELLDAEQTEIDARKKRVQDAIDNALR